MVPHASRWPCKTRWSRRRLLLASRLHLHGCLVTVTDSTAGSPSLYAAVNPNHVIFVMDGSIGQAAFDQAKAFHDSVDVSGEEGGSVTAIVAPLLSRCHIVLHIRCSLFEPCVSFFL